MHAFRRIFWKESRAQWQVWLGLLTGILIIQVVFVSASVFGRSPRNESILPGLFITAVVIGVCYAATSAAILVAGEREDETDFLLRTFPIPRLALLGGKFAFTLASLLALVGIGFASATVLAAAYSGGDLQLPASDLGTIARSMGGAFALGLFFSLVVDRVMVALGLAITAEFLVVGILGNFVPESWRDMLYWGIVAAVLAIDFRLAVRWLEGRPLFIEGAAAGGLPWPWKSVAPIAAPWSTRWVRLLQRLVATGSPETRATLSLVWRELRGAAPFVAIWGAAGFVLVDLAIRAGAGIPLHLLYLHITPVVGGLMTALGDQRRGTYRFLADHGVSPLRVWTAKIGTWLVVAFLMTVFFGWYDVMFAARLGFARNTISNAMLPVFEGIAMQMRTPGQPRSPEHLPGPDIESFLLSLGLMLFAVGQWASFLCRQPMVACAISIGLGAVAIGWHYSVVLADVPLALATWPVNAVLLFATAWEARPWLLGQSKGRFRIREALIVGLPLLVVLIAARAWRIAAIPFVGTPTIAKSLKLPPSPWVIPVGPDGIRKDPSPTQVVFELQDPSYPLRFQATSLTELYLSFRNPETAAILRKGLPRQSRAHALTRFSEMADVLVPTGRYDERERSDISEEPAASAPEAGAAVPAAMPPVDPPAVRPTGGERAENEPGNDQAPVEQHAGKLDPVTLPARWDGLLDLLMAAEYSAATSSDWDEWSRAVETRQSLMQTMRDWARLEGQTVAHLDAAITDLRKTSLFVSPISMLHRRNAHWQATVGESLVPGIGHMRPEVHELSFRAMNFLTGERERSIRLANALTSANLYRESGRESDPDRIPIVDNSRVEGERRRFGGWIASTALVPGSAYLDPMVDEGWAKAIDIQFQNQAAARTGTILCLLLQRYRLEHGTFPTDLATAIESLSPPPAPREKLLHDPYSGADFQYRPNGFPDPLHIPRVSAPWKDTTADILPAGQPLLWSVGPANLSIDRFPGPPTYYRSTRRGRATTVNGSTLYNDVSPRLDPAGVRFLILPP